MNALGTLRLYSWTRWAKLPITQRVSDITAQDSENFAMLHLVYRRQAQDVGRNVT